jgi:apolipoprotein N-acyltransferase
MIRTFFVRAGNFVRELEGWRARALAFVSGAAGALAFAPFEIFPLLLLSIGVLVLLIDGASARSRFIARASYLGWWWGFGQFLVGLYWIGYAFMVDPSAHAWQLPFAIASLTGGLALFPMFGAALAAAFWSDGARRIFLFAAAFGFSEWLRGHILTGFPWNIAAYGWGASLGVLQGASVVGAYGLTFLTFLFGASLAEFFANEPRVKLATGTTLLFVVILIGGELRLASLPTRDVPHVALRIIQPNIPQAEKFKRQFVLRNWQRLLDLSARPAKTPITHLIWPEAAPPFLLQREPYAVQQVGELLGDGTTLLTGNERVEFDPELRFFNSLFIYGPRAQLLGVYDKSRLVPFGEYVPFASLLNRVGITKITRGEAGFTAGPGPKAFAVPGAPPVGPLICYEILFPGAVVGEKRPNWFVNVTDDSWFGPSTGPYQHLLTARVRAIEEGVPVVRAANTGISAVIDALGRTKATLALDDMGALDAPLPAAIAPTPYARFGDLGFWLMLIACGATGVRLRRK